MFKSVTSKLEWLFDHDSGQNPILDHALMEAKKKFTAIENNKHLANLSYVFSGEVDRENISHLTAQIGCYFEMVFLCKRKDELKSKYHVTETVLYNKKTNVAESAGPFRLPKTPIFRVFRTTSYGFLSRLNLAELDPERKLKIYTLRLNENYSLVLACKTAEPWAKLKIETLQNSLMKINFNL